MRYRAIVYLTVIVEVNDIEANSREDAYKKADKWVEDHPDCYLNPNTEFEDIVGIHIEEL